MVPNSYADQFADMLEKLTACAVTACERDAEAAVEAAKRLRYSFAAAAAKRSTRKGPAAATWADMQVLLASACQVVSEYVRESVMRTRLTPEQISVVNEHRDTMEDALRAAQPGLE